MPHRAINDLDEMKFLTLESVTGMEEGSDEVRFKCSNGMTFIMYHEQDCCEDVTIYDIDGDPRDLVGGIVINAEAVEGSSPAGFDESLHDSITWTFYKIDTNQGGVTLRWLGESNGYYSESVDLMVLEK